MRVAIPLASSLLALVAFFWLAGLSVWSIIAASAVIIGSVGMAVYVWNRTNIG
jgi:hypothetical protein